MEKSANALLTAKLHDGLNISQKRPFFLGFLDESEAAFCEDFFKYQKNVSWLLWGGYPEAERRVLGLFPDFLEPDEALFPCTRIDFSFREQDALSHRDFLGCFMSLGVERDVVGDILVGKGCCTAFVKREMADYFSQNLRKIGRVGVQVTVGGDGPLPLEREFQEISGVVASERADCLVALLCRTSREKASALIASGMVMRNHRELLSVSERLEEGDVLSIRKQGKFMIDRLGPLTSKGRLSVQCRKYK